MGLEKIQNALLALTNNVFGYAASPNSEVPYIVYADDTENVLSADNSHDAAATTGTIDLYTNSATDPLRTSIPQALTGIGCSWYKNSTQFEQDTGLIHDEWVFEVI